MVVAEALAGIALVKSAVDGIKSAISTTNDVRLIAGHVDKLLQGRDEANKAKRDASNDPFSVKSIAEETINAKLAEEHLDEMRQLIDMRFGHGTWAGIIAERARRIREAKEAEARRRVEHRKKMEEIQGMILTFLLIGVATIVLVLGIIFYRKGF